MSRQYFSDFPNEPLAVANAAVTPGTSLTALFGNTSQIAIPAADVRPGKVWRLSAGGIYTSPGSTTTLVVTPYWGTTTGGVSLGASIAITLVTSVTAQAWWLQGLLMCRAVGLSGASSTFIAQGEFMGQGVAGTASSGVQISFGGTQSAVCDPTAGGFQIGITPNVTGSSFTPQIVLLQSLN